ncbi:MAG: guanylate kinase [Dehalococcoidia bacterium]|nr:guanylate kinase [Dehalococcoidia bacterium]MDW8119453.1 guanylate kinase [Chloroflexota bacterium]
MADDFLAQTLLQTCYQPKPLLVVLSGPSGAGKDTILARMRELGRPYHFVVTATTRPKRPHEQEGVDYFFLSQEEFERIRARQGFLEWAQVYGHYYGVPREQVRQALQAGRDVLMRVDVQGAATLRRLVPQAVFIFVTPPSLAELERRLYQRGADTPEALQRRLQTARQEMASLPLFDYLVLNENGRVDEAVAAVEAIICAEKRRIPHRQVQV